MAVSRETSSHFRPQDAYWIHLGPSSVILGDLGAILGHLEAILNDLGAIVGDLGLQLCVHLGSEDVKILIFPLFFRCFCCVGLQVIDGRFSVTLFHPGGMLSPTWRIWEPTWAHFGAILSYVGATLGDVGAIRGYLAPILRLPWAISEPPAKGFMHESFCWWLIPLDLWLKKISNLKIHARIILLEVHILGQDGP